MIMSLKNGNQTITDIFWGTTRIIKRLQNEKILYEYKKPVPPANNKFRFYNPGSNDVTLKMKQGSMSGASGGITAPTVEVEKSTDGVNFEKFNIYSGTVVKPGETLYLRGFNSAYGKYDRGYAAGNQFQMDYPLECHGNIMDLCIGQTDLAPNAFIYLFHDSKILTAPDLPQVEVVPDCAYYGMFENCSELTESPVVYGENVGFRSCYYMFANCVKLTKCGAILPLVIGGESYYGLFTGCETLEIGPEVFAESYTGSGSMGMANLCSYCPKLKFVCIHLKSNTGQSGNTFFSHWLDNVSGKGIVIKPSGLAVGVPSGWRRMSKKDMFYFTNESENENIVSVVKSGENAPQLSIIGSINDNQFEYIDFYKGITLNPQDKLTIYCFTPATCSLDGTSFNSFRSTTNIRCENGMKNFGNLTSVDNKFNSLFMGMDTLTNGPILDFVGFTSNSVYKNMFKNCTSLREGVLKEMKFDGVTGTLNGLFEGCGNLNKITIISEGIGVVKWDNSGNNSLNWTNGVSENGEFVKSEGLGVGVGENLIPEGVNGIPQNWQIIKPPFAKYVNNFDSMTAGTIPYGWDFIQPSSGEVRIYDLNAHSKPNMLEMRSDRYSGGTSYAVLPDFGVPINQLKLSMYILSGSWSYGSTVSLGYMEDGVADASKFVEVMVLELTQDWVNRVFDFSKMEIPGSKIGRLTIKNEGGSRFYGAYIDDVVVEKV